MTTILETENGPSVNAFGVPLTDTVAVRTNGLLVLVARGEGVATTTLYYNVSRPSIDGDVRGNWSGWYRFFLPEHVPVASSNERADSAAPRELRVAGMDLLTVTPDAHAADPANAPFRIVAQDRMLLLFRPSTSGTLYLNRLTVQERQAETTALPDRERADAAGGKARYVMEQAWEPRFRASGEKDVPATRKDSQSVFSPDGRPFFEPTIELAADVQVGAGLFDVALVPTTDTTTSRLCIVANGTAEVDGQNTPVTRIWSATATDDGVFDFSDIGAPSLIVPKGSFSGQNFPLPPLTDVAPTIAFYYEQDTPRATAATNEAEDGTTLQDGRVVVALPVGNAGVGLARATAVYDFPVRTDGTIPDGFSTAAPLVDGSLVDGKFVADDESPGFPTAAQSASVDTLVDGLVVSGLVLGQVQPQESPLLYAGSDGVVHLYYGGQDAPKDGVDGEWGGLVPGEPTFRVARFDTRATRAVLDLTWSDTTTAEPTSGTVRFLARRSGATMNDVKLTLTVVDVPNVGGDRCDVVIDYGASAPDLPTETWRGVPRDLRTFLTVMNGNSIAQSSDPRLSAGAAVYYDTTGERSQVCVATNVSPTGDDPGAGGQAPFASAVTLVSRRTDLALRSTTVAPGTTADLANVTIDLGSDDGSVAVTFPDAPRDMTALVSVLGGGDDAYAYERAPAPEPVSVLETVSQDGQDGIVFYPATGAPSDSSSLVVTVTSIENDASSCRAEFVRGERTLVLDNVARAQTDILAALERHADWAAFGLAISPGPLTGDVIDQKVIAPMTIAELTALFDPVLPVAGLAADVVDDTYTAIRQGRSYSASSPPSTEGERGMLALYAVLGTLPASGGDQYVEPTTDPVGPVIAGAAATWTRRAPTWELGFDGTDRMNVPVDTAQARNLSPAADFTFEAWVKPHSGDASTIVTYHRPTESTDDWRPTEDYTVAVHGAKSIQFGPITADPPSRRSTYLQTGTDRAMYLENDFTWEFWVQPDENPAPAENGAQTPLGYCVTVTNLVNAVDPYFGVGLDADRRVVIRYTPTGKQPVDITSKATLPYSSTDGPVWTHVAVTVARQRQDPANAKITVVIDGTLELAVDAPIGTIPLDVSPLATIGGLGQSDASVAGRMAATRFWSVARTLGQIRGAALRSVRSDEGGLSGLWLLDQPVTEDSRTVFPNLASSTGDRLDAELQANSNQPWAMVDNQFLLSLVAGVAGTPIEIGSSVVRTGRWNHVAVAYRVGGGLRLGGLPTAEDGARYDFAIEEEATSFGFDDALAIDSWIQLTGASSGLDNTIVARWAGDGDGQEFELYVDQSGNLAARVIVSTSAADDTIPVRAAGGAALLAPDERGEYPMRHVAAVLQLDNVEQGEGQDLEILGYYDLRLLIDGQEVARSSNRNPDKPITGLGTRLRVRGADTKLTIGMRDPVVEPWERFDEGDHGYFAGVIGETRVWGIAPTTNTLFSERVKGAQQAMPTGLVARWSFREQRGLIAFDAVRDDTLRLSSSDLWTAVRATSAQELYANGSRVWQTSPTSDVGYSAYDQFTLGRRTEGGVGIDGAMTEVRLWRTARTENEISENLYGWLRGDESDLTAYWTFADQTGYDETGGRNDANPAIDSKRFTISAAPVGNEGPQVLDTYGGMPTNFQVTTTLRPAVGALVAASSDRDGVLTGRLLRQYVWEDPVASLALPFKVGDLDLTFVGQVQTDAKLIGYVEGAPPVPSENLTSPFWRSATGATAYDGASSVKLTQNEDTALTYSSSRKTTSDVSFSGSVGPTWKSGQATAFGLGVMQIINTFEIQGKFVATTANEFNWGTGVDNTITGSWGSRSTDAFELTGGWEPSDDILNPTVGRRFVPTNLGSALVESLAADSYVMRDGRSGAMVGLLLVPNLAIPPDRNIITFPIDDAYTRQGSLDGRVGFVDDPDARRGSYFKPAEAYQLRERIERQAARDQAFFRQFDAQGRGQTEFSASLSGASQNVPVDFEADSVRRGLVNSYVWNADGGFHAEEETFSANTTSSYKGFFSRVNRAGFNLEKTFVFFVGMAGALSFAGGLRLDVSVGASDRRSLTFGLASTATGERYLHAWDRHGGPDGDGVFGDRPAPGKVKTYRFMTYYEPPSEENAQKFSDVIDGVWLASSNDAAAVALRQADTSNPAWRVRHRVTFVERVPPEASDQPVSTTAGDTQAPANTEGNVALLGLVQDWLGPGSSTPARIGRAVQAVLNPAPDSDQNYPPALVEAVVPWWGGFLAKARPGPNQDAAAAEVLGHIFTNVLDYVKAGYRTGVLPLSGD